MQEQNQYILAHIKSNSLNILEQYLDEDISNFFSSEYVFELEKEHLTTLSYLNWINRYLFKSCHYELIQKWIEDGRVVYNGSYKYFFDNAVKINTTEKNSYLILQILISGYSRCINWNNQKYLEVIENIIINIPNFNAQCLKFEHSMENGKKEALVELLLVHTKNITKEIIMFFALNKFNVKEPERFY